MTISTESIKRLTPVVTVAGFATLGILVGAIAVSRLLYPYDVGFFEAFIWTPARLIINGENPFAYATRPPFSMAPYGPFYYLVIGVGTKLFGLQLWFGRILSLLSTLVCLACLGRLTFLLTRRWQPVWLAMLAYLASYPVQAWLVVQRPDTFSIALGFVAVALAFEPDKKGDRITLRSFAIILLCSAAFFSKLTTLLPLIIATARYWQLGKHRRALFVFSGTVFLSAAMMILLTETSGSTGYLWQHFTYAQKLPLTYARTAKVAFDVFTAPSTWVFLLVLVVFFYRFTSTRFDRNWIRDPRLLAGCYLALAALESLISSARHGSAVNYYLETALIASLVVAVAWDWLDKAGHLKQWAYPALIVLIAITGGLQIVRVFRGEHNRWKALPYFREMVATLDRSAPPGSLCFSIFPELVTETGREYHFDDWMQYEDGWSPELQQTLSDALKSKRYAAIISYHTDLNRPLPGYHLAEMKEQPPKDFHTVYLFLRDP